jgi:hypothetical protein
MEDDIFHDSFSDPSAVQAVSVRLPAWWPDQPEVWFARAEAIFRQKSVATDETKFDHVLAALDNDAVVHVLDILRDPPTQGSYQAIKRRLIGSLALSEFERACSIIG